MLKIAYLALITSVPARSRYGALIIMFNTAKNKFTHFFTSQKSYIL